MTRTSSDENVINAYNLRALAAGDDLIGTARCENINAAMRMIADGTPIMDACVKAGAPFAAVKYRCRVLGMVDPGSVKCGRVLKGKGRMAAMDVISGKMTVSEAAAAHGTTGGNIRFAMERMGIKASALRDVEAMHGARSYRKLPISAVDQHVINQYRANRRRFDRCPNFDILRMHVVDKLTFTQIGKQIGMSRSAVAGRIHRARSIIARTLDCDVSHAVDEPRAKAYGIKRQALETA